MPWGAWGFRAPDAVRISPESEGDELTSTRADDVAAEPRKRAPGGILRASAAARRRIGGAARSVRWRPVLVGVGDAKSDEDEEDVRSKNPCALLASFVPDLRLWLLTYEIAMIPIRVGTRARRRPPGRDPMRRASPSPLARPQLTRLLRLRFPRSNPPPAPPLQPSRRS
jgi:hypothetical protein